jgi:hypothetical protein
MKRASLWVVAIGLFITVGFLAVGQAYAEAQHHGPSCTLKTLKGRYLFSLPAMLVPPAFGITEPTPGNAAGFHIFNGDGTGTDIVTLRIGGATVFSNAAMPITYTVNADCTGSYTVLNGGPSFDLFIAPDGGSIATITTAPPRQSGV